MHHLAAALSWPRVKALAESGAWALLPVGSTEAHGPHLPLNVDVVIAQEVCRRVAAHREVVEFPPVSYSLTDFAAPFSGTVSVPGDTAKAMLVAVLRGIAGAGFARVAVVNHHLEPAHFKVVHTAAAEAARERSCRLVVPDHRRKPTGPLLGDEFMHGGSHAGCYETSLMLAAAPHLVDEPIRRALAPVAVDLPGAIKAGATTFLEAGGPNAYFGDPAAASADEGERLLGIIVTATLDAMR
ncbi:MAG: creatininase family protein [Myxococcaceae bacterium]|jgi:creatinine amidohydrolase|nr:creatininase family protein [Myxococcaceae bacterium]MCA3012433.1 creatininase family protein [Myxococcaceae bacterium]